MQNRERNQENTLNSWIAFIAVLAVIGCGPAPIDEDPWTSTGEPREPLHDADQATETATIVPAGAPLQGPVEPEPFEDDPDMSPIDEPTQAEPTEPDTDASQREPETEPEEPEPEPPTCTQECSDEVCGNVCGISCPLVPLTNNPEASMCQDGINLPAYSGRCATQKTSYSAEDYCNAPHDLVILCEHEISDSLNSRCEYWGTNPQSTNKYLKHVHCCDSPNINQ